MFIATPTDVMDKILKTSSYMQMVQAEIEKDPEAESRLQNLDELINAVKEYEDRCAKYEKEASLSDFLQEISLLTGTDETQVGEGGAVTLMTVHLAKGLEFNGVFVTGLEENLFPLNRDDSDEMEEERRLCYVAMTRAREKLFMTYSAHRRQYGKTYENVPSRFLFESGLLSEEDREQFEQSKPRYDNFKTKYGLYGQGGGFYGGSKNKSGYPGSTGRNSSSYNGFEGFVSRSQFQKKYDEHGYEVEDDDLDYTSSSYRRSSGLGSLYKGGSSYGGRGFSSAAPRSYAGSSSSYSSSAPKQEKGTSTTAGDGKTVAVGGKVKHGAFGEGTITAVAGSGDSCKITVVFNNRVSRTFMLKFAALEIL
jgi:DNA helicase-2/ATP-dependent DNA helicase PcrA